jgi:cystinosin
VEKIKLIQKISFIHFNLKVILNYQRKSVVGFHFDFLYLNVLGYVAYSTYNTVLYSSGLAQIEYCQKHGPPNPVHTNDVFFALHGLALSLVQAGQCFYYFRGQQYITLFAVGFGIPLWLWMEASVFTWVGGGIDLLTMINWISYAKLIVTFLKYCPQVFFNYQRQSTEGWSIHNILLDLTGGVLSLLQGVLDWLNSGNYRLFLGDPVKFGLSIISIFFDLIFIFQHYVLYKHNDVQLSIQNDQISIHDSR